MNILLTNMDLAFPQSDGSSLFIGCCTYLIAYKLNYAPFTNPIPPNISIFPTTKHQGPTLHSHENLKIVYLFILLLYQINPKICLYVNF